MSFSRRSSVSMGSKSSDCWMLTEESTSEEIQREMSYSKWSDSLDDESVSEVSCAFEKIYRPQVSESRTINWCSHVSETCCLSPRCDLFHLEDVKNKPELLEKVKNLPLSVADKFKTVCVTLLEKLSETEIEKSVEALTDICFDFPSGNTPRSNIRSVLTLLVDDLYMDLHRGIPLKRREVISYILSLLFRPVQFIHDPYRL